MEKKNGKFINQEKILKNKIADLIAELHMIKYGKESPSELEGPQSQGGGSSYLLDAQPDSITKCLTFEKLLNLSLPQFLI